MNRCSVFTKKAVSPLLWKHKFASPKHAKEVLYKLCRHFLLRCCRVFNNSYGSCVSNVSLAWCVVVCIFFIYFECVLTDVVMVRIFQDPYSNWYCSTARVWWSLVAAISDFLKTVKCLRDTLPVVYFTCKLFLQLLTARIECWCGNSATFSSLHCVFLRHRQVRLELTKSRHDCGVFQIHKDIKPTLWESALLRSSIMQITFASICKILIFVSSCEEVVRYTVVMETEIVARSRTRSLVRSWY